MVHPATHVSHVQGGVCHLSLWRTARSKRVATSPRSISDGRVVSKWAKVHRDSKCAKVHHDSKCAKVYREVNCDSKCAKVYREVNYDSKCAKVYREVNCDSKCAKVYRDSKARCRIVHHGVPMCIVVVSA